MGRQSAAETTQSMHIHPDCCSRVRTSVIPACNEELRCLRLAGWDLDKEIRQGCTRDPHRFASEKSFGLEGSGLAPASRT